MSTTTNLVPYDCTKTRLLRIPIEKLGIVSFLYGQYLMMISPCAMYSITPKEYLDTVLTPVLISISTDRTTFGDQNGLDQSLDEHVQNGSSRILTANEYCKKRYYHQTGESFFELYHSTTVLRL